MQKATRHLLTLLMLGALTSSALAAERNPFEVAPTETTTGKGKSAMPGSKGQPVPNLLSGTVNSGGEPRQTIKYVHVMGLRTDGLALINMELRNGLSQNVLVSDKSVIYHATNEGDTIPLTVKIKAGIVSLIDATGQVKHSSRVESVPFSRSITTTPPGLPAPISPAS